MLVSKYVTLTKVILKIDGDIIKQTDSWRGLCVFGTTYNIECNM